MLDAGIIFRLAWPNCRTSSDCSYAVQSRSRSRLQLQLQLQLQFNEIHRKHTLPAIGLLRFFKEFFASQYQAVRNAMLGRPASNCANFDSREVSQSNSRSRDTICDRCYSDAHWQRCFTTREFRVTPDTLHRPVEWRVWCRRRWHREPGGQRQAACGTGQHSRYPSVFGSDPEPQFQPPTQEIES